MPTYTYACADCDTTFDTVQSIHDDALTVCPTCGGSVRRVISAVGVAFKGSGFYRTDSRAPSTRSTTGGTGGSSGSSAGDSSASKPASGATSGAASPA